jgi:hypothetical protein
MSQISETLEPARILKLLARSLPYFRAAWHDVDATTGLFGRVSPSVYSMAAVGSSSPVIENVVRPHLQVLCVLASFLRSSNGCALLGEAMPRAEAEDRLVRGLRWACETHLTGSRDVEQFLDRRRWGENWRSSHWASLLGLCGRLCQDLLPPDVRERINAVVAFEAERFVDVLPPSGCERDTKLEENALDCMVLAWAINLNQESPRRAAWERALDIWAINIASSESDRADHSEYLGRSVSHWVTTQNVYSDMTAENHGFFYPEVLSYSMWVVLAMSAYTLAGREAPACLTRRNHQETFEVLLRFCLPNGMMVAPGGQDLPMFVPRPFALGWGLWNSDPRALRLTERLIAWMEATCKPGADECGPWVFGLEPAAEGWSLLFQSQVGFELALLAALPFPTQLRFFSSGQIESAVDTRRIYPYVEVCYRRNSRTTRSVAWRTLRGHPAIGVSLHDAPELTACGRAALLGIPVSRPGIKRWVTLFHNDRFQRDGFETAGRMHYLDGGGAPLLSREVRVITWGDDGLLVLDQIMAEQDLELEEQVLSPLHVVNDRWTGGSLQLLSGSLAETIDGSAGRTRPISCPAFWASVQGSLLVQLVWGPTKGLVYLPSGGRKAPPYWKNCRMDTLGMHIEEQHVARGEVAYQVGLFVGGGKGPRPLKCSGSAGAFFKGLVFMDGKSTLGID